LLAEDAAEPVLATEVAVRVCGTMNVVMGFVGEAVVLLAELRDVGDEAWEFSTPAVLSEVRVAALKCASECGSLLGGAGVSDEDLEVRGLSEVRSLL